MHKPRPVQRTGQFHKPVRQFAFSARCAAIHKRLAAAFQCITGHGGDNKVASPRCVGPAYQRGHRRHAGCSNGADVLEFSLARRGQAEYCTTQSCRERTGPVPLEVDFVCSPGLVGQAQSRPAPIAQAGLVQVLSAGAGKDPIDCVQPFSPQGVQELRIDIFGDTHALPSPTAAAARSFSAAWRTISGVMADMHWWYNGPGGWAHIFFWHGEHGTSTRIIRSRS